MCIRCDNPTMTHEQYLAHLTVLIGRHGWAVQGVERDRAHPPWAYTVGLSGLGKPELVVTGLPLTRAAELLNSVAWHVVHDRAPAAGEQIPLIDGPVIEFVRLAQPDVHLCCAVDLYGPALQGMQVVWADDRGRWPWQVGFRCGRGGQPVLGPREAAA